MSHNSDNISISRDRNHPNHGSDKDRSRRRVSSHKRRSYHRHKPSNYRHKYDRYSRDYSMSRYSRDPSRRRLERRRNHSHDRRPRYSSDHRISREYRHQRHRRYSSYKYRRDRDYRRNSSDRYRRHSHKPRKHSHDYHHKNYKSHSKKSYDRRVRSPYDEIIHFKWEKDMKVGDYRVLNKISDGTFGRVLNCEKEGEKFALKVVRDIEKYTSSAKIEADILLDIKNSDEQNESHCVILRDSFMYKDRHMCLAFESLGPSLYDFLEKNDFKGFFIADIQHIAYQMLKGLSFLRKKQLIHTDIKPENILLTCGKDDYIEVPFPRSTTGMMTKRPATADIKIIDFGSAIYEDEYHSSIINTRQYRSPEVILDIGWTYTSDLWSLGCTLMELYTGHLLFRTHSHLEHLAMIEKILGKIPERMLDAARKTDGKHYVHQDRPELNWPDGAKSKSSIERVNDCRNVLDQVKPEHRVFAEFIKYILNPDSSARPSPEEAMEHEFFVLKLPEN
ncbi:protein kinase domain containing protein [Theileria equi strain WA]|uniref:Protein kinase domain containing protein n=1 Tax=Theileria equi strain WA TaxID=1537102 RepID=L0AZQ4_THEEQ|nr:protein kinase domain containing protein [Theileria equi strain WA]AFZ80476.1 protein kinase domain containing protein [Theileria equi strain WA]|eukprot:XP_004830142.1 protein kinase domain containing protein [Theileria equi strain WA]